MGGGGGRLVAASDLQRDAVPRRRQLFATGSASDVADLRPRPRHHLAGRHPLHDRHEHPRQRRSSATVHAYGDPPELPGVGITKRHGSRRHSWKTKSSGQSY